MVSVIQLMSINLMKNNMTPKEKAEELIDQFDEYAEARISDNGRNFDKKYCSKQCALKCVDEILYEFDHLAWDTDTYGNTKMKYWLEVKQEIEKL